MSTSGMWSARAGRTEPRSNLLADEQPAIQARMPESRQKQKQTTTGKLMKIKQNYLKVGLVVTAFTLLALAYTALAEDQVPFEGVEVGADTAGPFDFPFASILDTSEGEATHLGHFTKTGIIPLANLPNSEPGQDGITPVRGPSLWPFACLALMVAACEGSTPPRISPPLSAASVGNEIPRAWISGRHFN